ncbi:hypothetical protein NDA16_004637 [Ustilago loliicola]|nr:hypothetical protein NDA16_004637 [Ustilago loliicola]
MASASRTACKTVLRAAAPRTRSISHSTRASTAAASSSSTASTSSSAPESGSTSWQPRLKPGVLPAYDQALSFLSAHSSSLRTRISSIDEDYPQLSASDRAALKESYEIAASINDPSLLAQFQSSSPTTYDASNPTLRHLRERVWRKDSGVLAKLIERCALMHIFPDVVPSITPTADVQLAFGQGDGYTDHKSAGGDVLAGVFVPVQDSVTPPKVEVNVFHTEPKKYTLAIVDPDQPSEETQSYRTSLLALKTDITLSATTSPTIDLASNMAAQYIPPHPQQGTPYHRYTTILFEQSSSSPSEVGDRQNFDLNSFVEANGLNPTGVHFWRAKWTPESAETVSKIYTDVLKKEEPKYTKPPTLDKVRKVVGDIGSKWF